MRMTKINSFKALSIFSILSLLLSMGDSLRPYHFIHHDKNIFKDDSTRTDVKEGEMGMELYPTGSSLPDCTHACGACTPCRRVMISFNKCAVESCPVIYRCMCRGRFYHVPSN